MEELFLFTQSNNLNRDIINEMASVLLEYLSWDEHSLSFSINKADVFSFAEKILYDKLWYDIERFGYSDQAAANASNPKRYVVESYKGMQAVIHYRIANHLVYNNDIFISNDRDNVYRDPFDEDTSSDIDEVKNYLYLLARKISESAAIKTSVEINPSAKIGKGLVIDHGLNTKISPNTANDHGIVVGETCEIGENCTILNGVIIGAVNVDKGHSNGRRHPKIGRNVTICANARILGAIDIGDNVEIAPFVVLTHNVSSNSKISIVNQLQIEKEPNSLDEIIIYGLVPWEENYCLFGDNLIECSIFVCDSVDFAEEISVDIIEKENSKIVFSFDHDFYFPEIPSVCITKGSTQIYILQPNAIRIAYRKR